MSLSGELLRHIGRVDDSDAWIASKVLCIKRENMCHAIDRHEGDQPGIMYRHSGDALFRHETTPLVMYGGAVWQQDQKPLQEPGASVCMSGAHAVSSTCHRRTGANIPELDEVLRAVTALFTTLLQVAKGRTNNGMFRVGIDDQPKQDIGVY
jgi:hypothetical protein